MEQQLAIGILINTGMLTALSIACAALAYFIGSIQSRSK